MPELPDLVHVAAELRRVVRGQAIVGARVGDPVVLRLRSISRARWRFVG